jgi:hypothetical protein
MALLLSSAIFGFLDSTCMLCTSNEGEKRAFLKIRTQTTCASVESFLHQRWLFKRTRRHSGLAPLDCRQGPPWGRHAAVLTIRHLATNLLVSGYPCPLLGDSADHFNFALLFCRHPSSRIMMSNNSSYRLFSKRDVFILTLEPPRKPRCFIISLLFLIPVQHYS